MGKSLWQKTGRGYGGIFPHHPDVRYVLKLIEFYLYFGGVEAERNRVSGFVLLILCEQGLF